MAVSLKPIATEIIFIAIVPDGAPTEATPLQGFSYSLCETSWFVRAASVLPTDIFELTPEGREVLLSRRMSGMAPVNWYGQSPGAVRSYPHPPFLPFTVINLPDSEPPEDYQDWLASCPVRPTLVARSGGDLTPDQLTMEGLKARFLDVCERFAKDIGIDIRSLEAARQAIESWAPMPQQSLGYQVGGHNTIIPNLAALTVAGFADMESGRFAQVGAEVKPYVDQIVRTTNSILDHRAKIGTRDVERIYRRPPDLTLFAPAIFSGVLEVPLPQDMPPAERKQALGVIETLKRQTGYGFGLTSSLQREAFVSQFAIGADGKPSVRMHPIMQLRTRELFLNTDIMAALASSYFSPVVRLPNDVNRTLGSVRNFAEHYRSEQPRSRKRLLAFRQVQARLAAAVPAEFLELIRRSESGIRIVADAHLEWLDIDGLPLAIRKNCSRVPVTPGNLFVDHLASKRLIRLTPEDFREVLVMSALEPHDKLSGYFERAFGAFEQAWRGRIRVNVVKVTNAAEFASALNDFKGPLVIFDGHGGHSRDEPAVLRVGKERIDVWSLREKIRRVPPIVVLSACDTHAADRNHATTANGFMTLGARTVLSSVFPLQEPSASIFAARLVYRISEYLPAAIRMFDRAVTWTEVVSGMLRMQLLTDFLLLMRAKRLIDDAVYEQVHTFGNHAINGGARDPFDVIIGELERRGFTRSTLMADLEMAVATSSVISYLQVGRPETILIDMPDRIEEQFREMSESLRNLEISSPD
jgi:hypothetical protein